MSENTGTSLAGRMADQFGKVVHASGGLTRAFPEPATLAAAKLGGIGLTAERAQTIRSFARAVCAGGIKFTGAADPDEFVRRLCEIPGITEWTARYVCMRALGQPDAFPSTDPDLLRALNLNSPKKLECTAEKWRPWRAYAVMYLWKSNRHTGVVRATQRSPD